MKLRVHANEGTEDLIGRQWESQNGTREVVGIVSISGQERLQISTAGGTNLELLPVDQLERQIQIDESYAAMKQRNQQQLQEEKQLEEERLSIDGFGDTLTPRQRQRAADTLNSQVVYHGQLISQKTLVEQLVAEGATVEDDGRERVLSMPDGAFLLQRSLSKFALDYAQFLIAKNESY